LPPEHLAALVRELPFPDARRAGQAGLLCYGGDLAPERVLSAYAQGIFPWYETAPILWHSPDPRMVLLPGELRVNRTLRKNLRRARYEIRVDTGFRGVIEACRSAERRGQSGTWITDEMVDAYCALFDLGYAHCFEAWLDDELAGGVYGIALGAAFFGESMFARRSNASKIAFVHLVEQLAAWRFHFLDCQVHTPNTEALGAREWPRDAYLAALARALEEPTRCGRWSLLPGLVRKPPPARTRRGHIIEAAGANAG
jgi:leucyl/phenylalanyl-tRNA--protein transferase